jgi:molybdopterin-guanine dinucleotide biosynthesis protein A
MPKTRGVLLAGGEGKRLGLGIPKALAMLEGRTLLERALATLRDVCDSVVISMPRDRALPREVWRGIEVLWDRLEGEGPLAGLRPLVDDPLWDRALVMGVDFPLARPAALRALLERLEDHLAVVPAPGGHLQPLLAAYSRPALLGLANAFDSGQRSVVEAVRALRPRVLDDAELERLPGGLETWHNVNSPADLAAAARRLDRRAAGSRA